MRILVNKELVYVPEWNGNRNLPKEEQGIIYYRYMTGPEREKIYDVDIEFDSEGTPKGNYKVKIDRSKIIKTCIIRTEKMIIDDNGKEKAVTADDICSMSEFAGLYREMAGFFTSQNEPMDKKKLK